MSNLDESQGISGDIPKPVDLSAISKDLQKKPEKESFEQINQANESEILVNNEESQFFENKDREALEQSANER